MQAITRFVLEKWEQLRDGLSEGRGQALIEYALIGGAVAVVIGLAIVALQGNLTTAITNISNCIGAAVQAGGNC